MTTFTAVINIMLIALIAYMAYDFMATKHKAKRKINVYIDETNKIALVVPQEKASDEEIDKVICELEWFYTTRISVNSNLNIRGVYRKE